MLYSSLYFCTSHQIIQTKRTQPFPRHALSHSLSGNFSLILCPYRLNTIGAGKNANAINPSKEFPQPNPKLANIFGPANGKSAPSNDLVAVSVAFPDAACVG